jgi:chlorophyllase
LLAISVACCGVGCTGSSTSGGGGSTQAASTASATSASTTASTTTASTTTSSSTTVASATSSASPVIADPAQNGPYAYGTLDTTLTVPATSDSEALHTVFPTSGPTPGPYPLVLIAHGFLISSTEYYGYAQRLASFGFVAVTVDYPVSIIAENDQNNAEDLTAVIDWAIAQNAPGAGQLSGLVDSARIGIMGHSLGGKLAVIAASLDPRIQAVLGLDPVDAPPPFSLGGVTISAIARLPLPIPTAFLGETTDGTGGILGQPCAPVAENYQAFYAQAASPSLCVTVNGADHMMFVDDPANAGLLAVACTPGTASQTEVVDLAYAYSAAFFARILNKVSAYDADLIGATAQSRYVAPGLATIVSKW